MSADARQPFVDFFDAALTPLIRRMADRSRPGAADQAVENRQVRTLIWQGLVDLGAPVLTVARAAGGGGASHRDLTAISELLGQVLYQGPLLDTISATELLGRAGPEKLVTDIAEGASVALALRADAAANPAEAADLVVGDDRATIRAHRCLVGFAAEVDYLGVVGVTPAGTQLALVPRDHPTLALVRREETGHGEVFDVRCTDTPVTAWLGDAHEYSRMLMHARLRQAAYLVGLAQAALDLAVDYARSRRQFGQPLGRFQSLAFRLSELSLRIDAVRLLVDAAAQRCDTTSDDGARLAVLQGLAAAAELARAVTTAGLQIHGAAGMLAANDAQLFYRRAAVEALWLGSPTQLRAEAVPLLALRVTTRT